jgi:hypothetical protein
MFTQPIPDFTGRKSYVSSYVWQKPSQSPLLPMDSHGAFISSLTLLVQERESLASKLAFFYTTFSSTYISAPDVDPLREL